MRIKPYDTEKANPVTPLASPLGEEGHEVAKGVQANWIHRGAPRPANPVRRHPAKSVWTVVRMIMILLFYVLSPFAQGAADWRSGPRWSILSMLCSVHPFPLRGTSPQGETRDMREKQRVIYFTYHFGVSPLWWLAPPPSPRGAVGLWVLSHGAMSLQESIETYSAPCKGGSPAQPG